MYNLYRQILVNKLIILILKRKEVILLRKKINNVVKSNVELLTSPFMTFFRHEASSGIILLLFAILALVLANTSLSTFYNEVLNTQIPLGPAKWHLDLTILYWINDGLMAIFFFVIGLEIKREFLFGELKSLSALSYL